MPRLHDDDDSDCRRRAILSTPSQRLMSVQRTTSTCLPSSPSRSMTIMIHIIKERRAWHGTGWFAVWVLE